MDLTLPSEALNWRRRAKAFAEEHLFPHEIELEMNGSLPAATLDRLRRAVREHGLNGVNHAKDVGGPGLLATRTDADRRGAGQGDRRPLGDRAPSRGCAEARRATADRRLSSAELRRWSGAPASPSPSLAPARTRA